MSNQVERFDHYPCAFPNRRLTREVEAILAAKTQYDSEHPDHRKEMSPDELLDVAMASLFEKMCEPPEHDEDLDWEELCQ
jgi:hypothetical protein